MYTCPVCYYTGMQDPPRDYNICECCGTEFGNDDEALSHEELRARWIESGARWFFRSAPVGWNPWTQLFAANVGVLYHYGSLPVYGGAELETVKTVPAATFGGLPYYGAVTIHGGSVLEAGEAFPAANVMGLPYGNPSTMYGGYVLDTTTTTTTTTYTAQDVLAYAA
ncbi:MAG: hypothetical protein WBQ94_02420 [Terracidiphilus sp.]